MTKPVHSQEAFCRNHGRCLAGAGRSWSRDICFFQPASHCLHALLCCPDQQAAAMDLYGQGLQVLRGASQAQCLPTCSLPRAQWTTRAERVPKRVSCAAAAPPEAPSKPAKVDRQPAIPTIRQLANRRGMCVSRVRASWQIDPAAPPNLQYLPSAYCRKLVWLCQSRAILVWICYRTGITGCRCSGSIAKRRI